jgi:cellulose synthase/poly-beta-1,6-N-acetylglucosamine synthase-like glycosyltransferase
MLTIVANAMLMILSAALCVPVGMFCLEVLLALWPRRRTSYAALGDDGRVAVLIPAHNEEAVIRATLRTLMPTVPAGSRVVVVADNCSDATAAIARECGAEVVERHDAARRGKGFALDFGIRHLNVEPPDAIVFLDADCRVSEDTVRRLAAAAIATQCPVQGLNLCDPDPRGGVLQMASGLAFRFKNLVRTLGLVRLARLNHLTGTGMALPWSLVAQTKLADGNVVEDMQLGIDMTLAGKPPMFLPEARVDSPLPQQRAAARTQRTRWEHGHLKTLLAQSPRLAGLAIKHRRLDLFWLALDLAVPPLSLLVMTLGTAIAVATVAWLLGASPIPLAMLLAAAIVLAAAVLAGWAAYCREQVPMRALLAIPFYVAMKLPIYLAFFVNRQQQWVRTERDVART